MKFNTMHFSIILSLMILFLTSCSIKVTGEETTHRQIMDSYQNKSQIITIFGLPSTIVQDGGYEIWYFDHELITLIDSQSANSGAGSSFGSVLAGKNTGGLMAILGNSYTSRREMSKTRIIEQELKTFMKFTFQNEKVTLWETRGLDFGKYAWINQKTLK